MKVLKVSLIAFLLLSVLLMTSSPATAMATRIDFYGSVDPDTGYGDVTKVIESGPNIHLYGEHGAHVTSYYMNGDPFPYETGWAIGSSVLYQIVGGQELEQEKSLFIPDAYEGGYWEGTLTTIPNSGGESKVVLIGKGTYLGMHMKVTNYPDGTFIGVMTTKD
jgi:hypothetical protein